VTEFDLSLVDQALAYVSANTLVRAAVAAVAPAQSH